MFYEHSHFAHMVGMACGMPPWMKLVVHEVFQSWQQPGAPRCPQQSATVGFPLGSGGQVDHV